MNEWELTLWLNWKNSDGEGVKESALSNMHFLRKYCSSWRARIDTMINEVASSIIWVSDDESLYYLPGEEMTRCEWIAEIFRKIK